MKVLCVFFVAVVALIAMTESTYIQNGNMYIPLCFPGGFPFATAPAGQCYNEGFRGSIPSSSGACLAPIVRGVLVPPCKGQHYRLASFF